MVCIESDCGEELGSKSLECLRKRKAEQKRRVTDLDVELK